MATKARQIYTADEETLHKDKRTLEIESWYKTKIDGIEDWAQVNVIEWVKVNWTKLTPDAQKNVNVEVPIVVDNVYTADSEKALSANMGKQLSQEIENLKARWRFLSFWNAVAGKPTSEPPQSPYTYHTWDYFIVDSVATAWWTNYRPEWTSYTTGDVSTTVETELIVRGSMYIFDWEDWLLQAWWGWGGTAQWWQIVGTLSDQTDLKWVLDSKITNPASWTAGQVLTKTASWAEWKDIEALPELWEDWQVLTVSWWERDTQWPSPVGYHVPTKDEWKAVYDAWVALWQWSSTDWDSLRIKLKMPFAGLRYRSSSSVSNQGSLGYYWSSTASSAPADSSYYLRFDLSSINPQYWNSRTYGFSVRCFKNCPLQPSSNWTTIYAWSNWAWIYHSVTEWVISISSDWQTWITIADKNLWATTVYNDWDILSQANCWYYYQWWNNYGFPWTWAISKTSSTQVDASAYWPWNYYSNDTFIVRNDSPYDWSSVQNDNLWWWVTDLRPEKKLNGRTSKFYQNDEQQGKS